MSERPEVHAWQLDMFGRCEVQYEFRVMEGLVIRPGMALIVGTGTHSAVEMTLKHKLERGTLAPLEQMTEEGRDVVRAHFTAGNFVLSAEQQAERSAQGWADFAVEQTVGLAGLYQRVVAPGATPLHVERPWQIIVPDRPFDLGGRIDLDEGQAGLRDLKTKAKKPSKGDADQSVQLTMYRMAKRVLDGVYPERLRIDYLVKSDPPRAWYQETARTEAHEQAFLRRLDKVAQAMERGVFAPTGRGSDHWWCSPKWCGYWSRCPYVADPVSVSVTQSFGGADEQTGKSRGRKGRRQVGSDVGAVSKRRPRQQHAPGAIVIRGRK